MAKNKELTVEEKLRALYNLQLIDSRVDEIRNIRGELPLEVRDLEDEVEGFKLRLQKLEDNLNDIDNQIKNISVKQYENLEGVNSLDFIFVFINIEGALLLALQHNPSLFDSNRLPIIECHLMLLLQPFSTIDLYLCQQKR